LIGAALEANNCVSGMFLKAKSEDVIGSEAFEVNPKIVLCEAQVTG